MFSFTVKPYLTAILLPELTTLWSLAFIEQAFCLLLHPQDHTHVAVVGVGACPTPDDIHALEDIDVGRQNIRSAAAGT